MVLLENNFPKVLLVDDKAENITILIDMLEPLELNLFVALNAKEVYNRVSVIDFDLILLDIIMPEIDGYEVCKVLKNDALYKDIPLIFISSLSGVDDRIKGFSYGADDYISKPLVQDELLARVKLHLQKGLLYKSLKNLLRKSYHELYNPLAIINTSLEMQNIKYGNNKYSDSITVASRTLQVVYDDLYYSLSVKNYDEDIEMINFVEFIKKRINYFYYLRKTKNITIEFKTIEFSDVNIKEVDLQRIVDNTISNAIKYALQNSTVIIALEDKDKNIIFKSTNIGSTIKNPKKIFTRGYREGFEQIGMGIGLEIVSSICHNYGIKPYVSSIDGVTTFSYEIPKS